MAEERATGDLLRRMPDRPTPCLSEIVLRYFRTWPHIRSAALPESDSNAVTRFSRFKDIEKSGKRNK
jgi:hypothetical protein